MRTVAVSSCCSVEIYCRFNIRLVVGTHRCVGDAAGVGERLLGVGEQPLVVLRHEPRVRVRTRVRVRWVRVRVRVRLGLGAPS